MNIYTETHRSIARALHPHIDNFIELGGPDWRIAARLRESAFHHAGHLWAAHRLGCSVGTTVLDGRRLSRFAVFDAEQRASLASAGVLAAAAYPLADLSLELDGAVHAYHFDYDAAWEALLSVSPCDRLDDTEAESLVSTRESALNWLTPLVCDWPRIHKVAMRLIEGHSVDDTFLDEVMDPWAQSKQIAAMMRTSMVEGPG